MTELLQFYGQFGGYWSNCGVSRGLARGLHANGVRLQVFETAQAALGDFDPSLYVDTDDLQVSYDPEAKAGLFVGYPIQSGMLDAHDVKIGAFIAESEVLPEMWVRCADRCDLIAVPSDWLRNVFIEHGINKDRVLTVPHGLDPRYFMTPPKRAPKMNDGTRFLHISGARDFPWRKGTPQLIEAFKLLFGPSGPYAKLKAKLVLRTPDAEWIHKAVLGVENLFVLDLDDGALSAHKMMQRYCDNITALVQPSAVEAFGICPLEARAIGIPVICTHCTGHAQHKSSTDTVIVHGDSIDMRANGIPKGRAPEITTPEVIKGIVRFMNRLRAAIQKGSHVDLVQPDGYLEQYTWQNATKELASRIKGLL